MAAALYDSGREGFLDGSIDWDTDTIKICLCTSSYVRNLATHDNLDDVTNIVATSGALTGKTKTGGVADADDVLFTALSGSAFSQIVIFKDTGTASTSRLIANIDAGTGLPFTPSGGDVTIRFDSGANKIFKL